MHDLADIDWNLVLGADRIGLDRLELSQFVHALGQHSRRSIRLRSLLPPPFLPFEVTPVPWNEYGRWVANADVRPGAFLHYAAGDYYIQDATSMLALTLCRVQSGESVCDVCAAPGGKATGLVERLDGSGFLVANEVISSRLTLLEHALYRTGWGNIMTTNLDVEYLAKLFAEQFDCVLVDAPCTGQSMAGSQKQSPAAFRESQIAINAARQRRILNAAARLVRPGGRLVYSTCTYSVAENEQRVEQFLEECPSWQTIEYPELARWTSPRLPGCYRLWPHRDACDGGFAVAMRRVDGSNNLTLNRYAGPIRARRNSKPSWNAWSGNLSQFDWLESNGCTPNGFTAWQRDQEVHLFANQLPHEMIALANAGVPLAELRNNRAEPSYASAVVNQTGFQPAQCIELGDDQAIRFASGESVQLADPKSTQGWTRVDWQGRSLAWGKISNGVLKNHLPKLLRLPQLIVSPSSV